MRTPIPIVHPPRADSPAPLRRPGLVLAQPRGRCGRVAWLHARITLAHVGKLDPAWLRNLHVTAITSADQIVQIASLWRASTLARPLPWQPLGDGVHASLSFCFDLGAVVDYPLHGEPLFVHLSCDSLCSESVVLGTDALPVPVVEDPIALDDPLARLLDAYTLARLDRPIEAVALFEAVLAHDRELRTHVDACHLYNAACMLSRAGVQRGALRWLREDALRRVHAQTAAELAAYAAGSKQPDAAEAALREHFQHLERDPDLELLGEQRRVASLLEGHR
ncbi:MAG TPA: hypothetical protein VM869_08115 [Enhygromyxa sp.]|nr:hypothetical protein [Enhygromyxa sp.]